MTFFEDMVEILEPYIDMNTGASGEGNYGNYVEFPDGRSIEEHQIEQLLDYFGIEIPFDEEVEFSAREALQNYYQLPADFIDQLQIDDEIFMFPSLTEIRDEVIELLVEKGAPIGQTLYEDAGEIPAKYMYFASDDEDDEDYYNQYSIEFLNYSSEIENIKTKLRAATDDIVKKSLLLASFVYTESFIRSKVRALLPDLNTISDDTTKDILKKFFDDKLGKTTGRKELFKKYFGSRQTPPVILSDMPHVKLRNILAHDISSSRVQGLEIEYQFQENNNGIPTEQTVVVSMTDLIDQLEHFAQDLEDRLS
ncbi:TPA: hypothetical protein ACGOZ0_001124 [Streptococcus suis]